MSKQASSAGSVALQTMKAPTAEHSLGYRLKYYRLKAGLSQSQLTACCGWASANGMRISHYERGVRQPSVEDLKTLAFHLGVTASDLTYGDQQAEQGSHRVEEAPGCSSMAGLGLQQVNPRMVQHARAVIAMDRILQAIAAKGTSDNLLDLLEGVADKIAK